VRSILAAGFLATALSRPLWPQCPDGTPPPCARPAGRPTASRPAPTSIAVLDPRNLSPDTADTYLAEGLAEELTSRLGQVGRIVVKARTAVERLRGAAEMSTDELGRALDVTYLVGGSIRRSGPRLRVSVHLLRASTGDQVWASQYDRDATDLLAIQEEIATAVAEAIVGRLAPAERTVLVQRPTRNPVAFDSYLRGSAAYRAGRNQDAMRALRQATSLDSNYAEAFALLSRMYAREYWGSFAPHDSLLVLSRAAVDRAIALAPERRESRLALGYYHYHGFRDYARALEQFSLAQRAAPNDPEVLSAIAFVARRQGRWDVSVSSLERALALDPADTGNVAEMLATLHHLRRWDEADAYLDRYDPDTTLADFETRRVWGLLARGRISEARRMAHRTPRDLRGVVRLASPREVPTLAILIRVDSAIRDTILTGSPASLTFAQRSMLPFLRAASYQALSRDAEALAAYDSIRPMIEMGLRAQPNEAFFHGVLAYVYASLGRPEEARREAELAERLLPTTTDALVGPSLEVNQAWVLVLTGDHDAAIDKLERLMSIPAPITRELLQVDPMYDPLKGNPRFQRLLRP
jgi:TolB-like protein/Tfp pilus assembly protein PilF